MQKYIVRFVVAVSKQPVISFTEEVHLGALVLHQGVHHMEERIRLAAASMGEELHLEELPSVAVEGLASMEEEHQQEEHRRHLEVVLLPKALVGLPKEEVPCLLVVPCRPSVRLVPFLLAPMVVEGPKPFFRLRLRRLAAMEGALCDFLLKRHQMERLQGGDRPHHLRLTRP